MIFWQSSKLVAYQKHKTIEYIYYQICGPKSDHGCLRKLITAVVAYKRVFKTVFDWDTKWLFTKWSLMGGGRLREVVTRGELTVLNKS